MRRHLVAAHHLRDDDQRAPDARVVLGGEVEHEVHVDHRENQDVHQEEDHARQSSLCGPVLAVDGQHVLRHEERREDDGERTTCESE